MKLAAPTLHAAAATPARRGRGLIAALLAGAFLAGCSSSSETAAPETVTQTQTETVEVTTTDTVVVPEVPKAVAELSQRQQVARLLMVGVTDVADARHALAQGVGGIFIGSWTSPEVLANIEALREEAGRPFAVAIDAEGGRVMRQPEMFGRVPAPRDLAQQGSPEDTRRIAFELGQKLRAAGVTVDFAPVVDTAGGPPEGAIGDRSFSPDPAVVRQHAAAFGAGLADAGVTPVYKHFPGHGRASGDTHLGSGVTPPIAELGEVDLLPYGAVLAAAPGDVMVGHVIVPDLGPEGLPSSLNPAVYQLLRSGDYPGGQPFEGVIYTDDLTGMKAISDKYGAAAAAEKALEAGADVALWINTDYLSEAIDLLDRAVTEGQYPKERMLASVTRVIQAVH